VETFAPQSLLLPLDAKIAGYEHPVYVSPPDSHFAGINILGGDFCHRKLLRPWLDDEHPTVTYYVGKKWQVVPKL